MSTEPILAAQEAMDRVTHYAAVLSDFQQRMTASNADRYLNIDNGSVKRAFLRGEIQPYRMPDHPKTAFYTPLMLAEWLETYCRPEVQRLPG